MFCEDVNFSGGETTACIRFSKGSGFQRGEEFLPWREITECSYWLQLHSAYSCPSADPGPGTRGVGKQSSDRARSQLLTVSPFSLLLRESSMQGVSPLEGTETGAYLFFKVCYFVHTTPGA